MWELKIGHSLLSYSFGKKGSVAGSSGSCRIAALSSMTGEILKGFKVKLLGSLLFDKAMTSSIY